MSINEQSQQRSLDQTTLQQLPTNEITSKKDEKEQIEKPFWTFRKKIILGCTVILVLIIIGLTVGLYYRFRTRLDPTSPITRVNLQNGGSYALGEFELKEKRFFSDDVKVKLLLAQAVSGEIKPNTRRLQQNPQNTQHTSDYRTYINLQETGFHLTLTSDDKLLVNVQPQTLVNYLLAQDPQAQRLLAQTLQTNQIDQNVTTEQLLKDLSKVLNEELGVSSSVQFKQIPMVQFAFNNQTSNFQIVEHSGKNDTSNMNSRRMLMVRMLSWKKFWKKVTHVVQAVVKPVVQVVRKNGPIIGAVAGFLVGGLVAGPVGAAAGFKIGATVGLVAKTAIQACVPKDTLTVKCTAESVKQAAINAGVSVATTILCGQTICDKIADKSVNYGATMVFGK